MLNFRTFTRITLPILAAFTLITGISATPASANPNLFMTQTQIKKALLTPTQISALTKTTSITYNSVVCHSAPYYKGTVNYCYYENMHSTPAYTARQLSPNHIDIISFDTKNDTKKYLKEMRASTGTTLASTPTTVIKYNAYTDVPTNTGTTSTLTNMKASTVAIFTVKGTNVVYTECAAPANSISVTTLTACARSLTKAQLARIT